MPSLYDSFRLEPAFEIPALQPAVIPVKFISEPGDFIVRMKTHDLAFIFYDSPGIHEPGHSHPLLSGGDCLMWGSSVECRDRNMVIY